MSQVYDVDEITYTLQGEGERAGHPSVFIRFAGCNLRCSWCDQPDSLTKVNAQRMTAEEILDKAAQYPTKWLVLTGGEPLARDLSDFCLTASNRHYFLAVETNGTRFHSWVPDHIDHITVSPKNVPGGDVASGFAKAVWAIDEFKFIIDSEESIAFMDRVLEPFDLERNFISVYLQPEWGQREKWLPLCVETVLERGGLYRLSLQTHKLVGLP